MKLVNIFKLLRPKHWIKNGLIAAPLFFSFAFSARNVGLVAVAVVAFCLLASGIYVINDIADRERDRLHPKKRLRPIAAGKVTVGMAVGIAAVLYVVGFGLMATLGVKVLAVAAMYVVMNLAYSFYLKHTPIVDVMIVSLGFVMRVMIGAYAIGVPLSHWILLCTFFAALFMSFGKRKHEMGLLADGKGQHRRASAEYTDRFVDQMLAITAGVSVVFYSLYTIDPANLARFGSEKLIYTTPIVVFGVFRYYYLMYNRDQGGDPVQLLLKDKQLILCVLVWLLGVLMVYMNGKYGLFA